MERLLEGGADDEGMVVTGHVARVIDTIKFVLIVRDLTGEPLVPAFLGQRPSPDATAVAAFQGRPAPGLAAPRRARFL